MKRSRSRTTTTRALRENLRAVMARAARGEDIVVTRRGRPYVRIVAAEMQGPPGRYALRGASVIVAEDFDAPMPELWAALQR